MTTKPNKHKPKKKDIRAANPKTLQFAAHVGETEGQAHSRMMCSPSVNAATTMFHFHPMKDGANISDLVDVLGKQVLTIRDGCMDRPEAMLVAQAHALDTIFTALSQRAVMNMNAGYLPATETYLRMALKAQSQCRTTLEALSEIKNPRAPTFIRQQNVAHQQQVNNGVLPDSTTNMHTRAREKDITPTNELLEVSDGERLDIGTEGTPSRIDSGMAAVGTLNRTQDGSREGGQ